MTRYLLLPFPAADCWVCGDELHARTDAPQQCDGEHPGPCGEHCLGPFFCDGDELLCLECGAAGWVIVDEDGSLGWNYDWLCEHNVLVADRYTALENQKEKP